MNESRRLANRFGQISREGYYVMIGRLFYFVDALDGKLCATLYLFEHVARNRSHFGVDFADSDFHVQPFLELGLFRPERAHFGKSVAIDHKSVSDPQITQITQIQKTRISNEDSCVSSSIHRLRFLNLCNLRNLRIHLSP